MITSPFPVHDIHHDFAVEIESLFRELLDRLEDGAIASVSHLAVDDQPHAEVMLELQIDGVPYRLIRVAPRQDAPAGASRASLSPREREIVRLVARGLPNKSIAQVLDISLWTVATHLRRVFAKLSVGTRAEMIARIHEEGLLLEVVGAEATIRPGDGAPIQSQFHHEVPRQ